MFADVLFTIGAIMMAAAPTVGVLMGGRFVVGVSAYNLQLGVGIASMIVPVYISEAAPTEIRGKLVTCFTFMITFGQVISYVVCLILGDNWRAMLGLAGVPSLIQLIGMIFLDETPSFLYKSQKEEKAMLAVSRIYKQPFDVVKQHEFKSEASDLMEQSKLSYFQQFLELVKKYRKCLLIGMAMMFFQQFAGINTIMYYGPTLMQKIGIAGSSKQDQIIAAIPLACINASGAIIAFFIIDNKGRRWTLLRLIPFVILSLLLVASGIAMVNFAQDQDTQTIGKYLAFLAICSYLVFFSTSLSPVPWTLQSEIFPLHLRGAGNSASTFSNWFCNFIISEVFLSLTKTPTGTVATFVGLALVTVGGWFFVYYIVPETKDKGFEEILSDILGSKHKDHH